jgi:hypothetical protein
LRSPGTHLFSALAFAFFRVTSCILLFVPEPPARLANAETFSVGHHIVTRQWVAVDAVGLASLLSRDANASKNVLSIGYWFEVIGVNAARIPAEVVQRHTLWNLPNQNLIAGAMSAVDSSHVLEVSITLRIARGNPLPTSVRGLGIAYLASPPLELRQWLQATPGAHHSIERLGSTAPTADQTLLHG